MSEEIALASADMAHVARLRELVNHWCIAARDLDAALQWAERERDAARAERDYWRIQAQDTLVDLHAAERELDASRAVVQVIQQRHARSGFCICGFGKDIHGAPFHGAGCPVAAYEALEHYDRRGEP